MSIASFTMPIVTLTPEISEIAARLLNQITSQPVPSYTFPADSLKTENAAISALKSLRAFTFVHEQIGPAAAVNAAGAIGPNQTSLVTVRYQTTALWLMRHGIARGLTDLINKSNLAFAWAFGRQNVAGYFENFAGEGGTSLAATTAIEGDTFFIASFVNAYRLVQGQPELASLVPSYASLNTALNASLSWMEANNSHIYSQATQTPNRLMFAAMAFCTGGVILSNSTYSSRGLDLVTTALAMRHADGYFIEKGGWDTSYQGVIIMLMSFVWMHATDPALRSTLKTALGTAVDWEMTRITQSGASAGLISTDGNTRTGPSGEVSPLTGKVKWPNYPEVALGLFYAGYILERLDVITTATNVVRYAAENWQTLS